MVSFIALIFAALLGTASYVGAVPFSNLNFTPLSRRQDSNDPTALNNAQLAQQMNLAAETAQVGDPCPTDGVPSCIGTGVSQCESNQLLAPQPCGSGTQCIALPLVGQAGVVIACDTLSDAIMRISSTGATGGLTGTESGAEALAGIPGAIPAVPKVLQQIQI